MGRKRRQQASKAARAARKLTKWAGLSPRTGHPCHQSGRRWRIIWPLSKFVQQDPKEETDETEHP